MYHVEIIEIKKNEQQFAYADFSALAANNMTNVANFHIRNLMTGLKKKPEERTPNENDVIQLFEKMIPLANVAVAKTYSKKVKKIENDNTLSAQEKKKRIEKIKCRTFGMPTAEKWFADYGMIDAVMKMSNNPDYRAHHIHLIQNAVKDCVESWLGYFKILSLYKEGDLSDRPNIPGYKKSGGRTTAVFSNVACKIKHKQLIFPYVKTENINKDKRTRMVLPIGKLPHAAKDKLNEVRIVPYFDRYQVQIITDDGIKEEDVIPKEDDIIQKDGTPAGVMMLDPGLNNFASIVDNKGNVPIVIKGGALKARNQWYNKEMAFLKSCLMKGKDPKTYHPPTTKRMKALSRKRDAFLRDTFYKYAHYICRLMVKRGLTYLIIGRNEGQKQNINIGHVNNQEFVQLPHARFFGIIETVARQYSICVLYQEESYTSKACFAANDPIPKYGDKDAKKTTFSGRRIKRGLYKQNDGKILNADINGSANIGRKRNKDIFPKGMDISYLYRTVQVITYKDILKESHTYCMAQ